MVALRTKILSNTIFLPELEKFIGKDVVITIDEAKEKKNLKAFFDCVNSVEIDSDLIEKSREISKYDIS